MVQFRLQICRKIKRKKKLYPITSEEVNNTEKHYKKNLDSNLKKYRKEMNVKVYENFTKKLSEKYWKILNTGKSTF